jgi:hypothetical protein
VRVSRRGEARIKVIGTSLDKELASLFTNTSLELYVSKSSNLERLQFPYTVLPYKD